MAQLKQDESGNLWGEQDKDAFLDYALDWSDWLVAGDEIDDSMWTADSDLTLNSQAVSGALTSVWVQGGSVGKWYAVTNTVTSLQGRSDQRTIRLLIVDEKETGKEASALFPNLKVTIGELRRDQIKIASQYALPGKDLSDSYLTGKLLAAESDAARQLRVLFQPTKIIPEDAPQSEIDQLEADGIAYQQEAAYDYDANFFRGDRWGFIVTKQKPIVSVQSIDFAYPSPAFQVFSIPHDWIRMDKKFGHIRLVPASQTFSAPLSAFIMSALGGGMTIPFMIRVRYTAGLSNVARDYPDLIDVVKKMAVLRILEDAFLPQSGSISSDGLSQSLSMDVQKWHDGIDDKLNDLRDAIHGPRIAFLGHV